MSPKNSLYAYQTGSSSFASALAAQMRMLYFPLCGPDVQSIKSSITPFLSGDIKIDKHRFLTKPVSRKDLRQDVRNFFVSVKGKGVFSFTEESPGTEGCVEAGQLWHKLTKKNKSIGVQLEATNFVPVEESSLELMRVVISNISSQDLSIVPTSSLPVFGRALNNKHDHEHVTALLHRTRQVNEGIIVEPTMLFNEEKHVENHAVYYVFGVDGKGKMPVGSFPTAENFCGEGGTLHAPEAVIKNTAPTQLQPEELNGKEVVGALRFDELVLKPGESQEYFLAFGIASSPSQAQKAFAEFNAPKQFQQALEGCKEFWRQKSRSVKVTTGNQDFDAWLEWVTLQPVLRRIYGCSFLPDHDYGKGGKGWRDIWQDLLSLILVEPENVRTNLVNNFAGVRVDGSNATIIGLSLGEFFADRNGISRVWMDHGAWPLLTLALYIEQTGDYDILLEKSSYFKDFQLSRSTKKDPSWNPKDGYQLKGASGNVYEGSLLEHMLIQHLVCFFNVGEHNIARLEHADWNDGLDMAFSRGESVAFMSFYGGNLLMLADLIETLAKKKGLRKISLAAEVLMLLDSFSQRKCDYNNPEAKRKLLHEEYLLTVESKFSGGQKDVAVSDLVKDLRYKGEWIFQYINKNEKVAAEEDGEQFVWFNGYYDNQGQKVEGQLGDHVRMTLTGQVFPIMSGLAGKKEIEDVTKAVKHFLQDKALGGFRLNTDFKVRNYLDLGRAFSFAYGTKENGAFFSHMAVMYAYALYKRGFVREGAEVLSSIYQMCIDTPKSKIYPGIPEYFDAQGRGMYPYLTGAASWLILTELTQVFGVRGEGGDLVIFPKLLKEEFDGQGEAKIHCQFAGKRTTVKFINKQHLDFGEYEIKRVTFNNQPLEYERISEIKLKISRDILKQIDQDILLEINLG